MRRADVGSRVSGGAPGLANGAAFTLIELLVVVAIIALLISILLPSLAAARAQARATVCVSNEHQFGIAASAFAAESKGYLPRGGDYRTLSWVQLVVRQMGDMKPYIMNINGEPQSYVNLIPVEKLGVFHCPERESKTATPFLDYIINALDSRGPRRPIAGAAGPPPRNSSEWQTNKWYEVKGGSRVDLWRTPAKVIYLMDAALESDKNTDPDLAMVRTSITSLRANPGPGIDMYDIYCGSQLPGWSEDVKHSSGAWTPRAALQMHARGSNAAFADGHAAAVRPPVIPSKWDNSVEMEKRYQYYVRLFGVSIPSPAPSRISKVEAGLSDDLGDAGSPEGNRKLGFDGVH